MSRDIQGILTQRGYYDAVLDDVFYDPERSRRALLRGRGRW